MREFVIYLASIIVFWIGGDITGRESERRMWESDCTHTGRHVVSDTAVYTCAPEKRP